MHRESRILVEIRVGGERLVPEKHESNAMRFLDRNEFVHLLQLRLGKSEPEIQQLLESYRPSTSSL
jgi:hypothetical protein